MAFAFFSVSVLGTNQDQDELNRFLVANRCLQIHREWSESLHAWTFCIEYLENRQPLSKPRKDVDYRELLNESQFSQYSKLRTLRKDIAEKNGVPNYVVFTNEQLAEMVKNPVKSLADLQKIAGIGASRTQQYGQAFLDLLLASQE